MAINQLPAANYVPAKITMSLIYPRIDAETDTYARHKFAHTGMDYRIPIGVMGGAWPFYYEVISGPTGLTVGGNYGDTDYGVVNWPAASVAAAGAGPHSVTVRVTDQDKQPIDAVWAIAVDDTQFVFINSATGTSGVGTIGDPLKLFTDWFEGDIASTTYQDKIAVFRAGTYTVTGEGSGANGNNVDYACVNKTRSIIGFPGETATLDHGGATGGAKWYMDTEYYDFFVAGLTFYNARQDVENAHFFQMTNSPNPGGGRVTFHENIFDTCDFGTVGTSNAGPLFFPGSPDAVHREYLLLKGNTSTNITPTGNNNGHNLATVYLTNYVLIEENLTYGNNVVAPAVNAKGTEKFVTIRANNFDSMIIVNLGGEVGPRPPHDHEVCWNKVIIADGAGRGAGNVYSLIHASSPTYEGAGGHYNDYIYRNTFKGGSANVRFAGDELYEVEGNIVEHSANNYNGRWNPAFFKPIDTGRENLFVDDIEDGSFNTAFTDASGNLFDDAGNGNARTAYLGTKGAELGINTVWSAATNTAGTLVTVTLNEAYTTTTAAYTDFTIAGHTITTGTGLQLTSGTSFTLTVDDAIGSHEDLVVAYDGTGDFTADSDSSVIAAGDIGLVNNSTVDQVAPVLTTPIGTSTGNTTATGTVTTDEGNGTLYWEVTASATPTSPNATFISDATTAGDTQVVSATGSQIVSVTGLTAATSYYIHFLHVDAASNESNVSTSAQFTTQSLTAPTLEQGVMNPNIPVIDSTGSTLTLTFSEAVTTSAATGLTLSTGETLTYSSGSTTDTIVYTISPYAQAGGGGEILNFAGGANVIEATVGGTDVEAFSNALVSSQSTATAPVVVGDPTVDETGTLLTVVFSSASLANQTTPSHSPFTLTGTLGGVYTFTNASIPANTGVFTVSPAVEYNDVLSLSFTQAGGTFTDGTTGIELATFTDAVVNNTSSTDNEPPIFTSAPDVSKTTVQGHTIRQTINETGVVYGVRLAKDSGEPSASEVKAGVVSGVILEAKSVATTAGSPCVLVFSSGVKNTEYDYYIVAEDSVPNLQAVVVKVTATTANLLFNGSGGKGLRPDEDSKKKVKMMWDSKGKRR